MNGKCGLEKIQSRLSPEAVFTPLFPCEGKKTPGPSDTFRMFPVNIQ